MHETSPLWRQILSEPDHRKEIKVKINGTEYGLERIVRVSVVGRLFDAPGVGNAFSRTLDLKIVPYDGPNGRIPPLSEIRLFARLVSADGQRVSEYIPKGVFYSDEAKQDTVTGAVSVTAFDAIMKMNVLFGVPKKGGGYGPVTTFTVSFNDGFYNIQKFRVASGGIMPTPATPTHDGERFLAWYPDPLETPTVTRDMRFTAKWAQKHTVVFAFPISLDSGPVPNQQFSSFEGEPTPMPIEPETPGHRLSGWLPELEFVETGDMIYTAVFSEITASGDYWNLYDDGAIIFDIPSDGAGDMTPEKIWKETLTEIAPHIDDIITIVITDDTPLPPEILAELVETLPNLEEIVLPPSIDLEEILGLIDVDLEEILEIIDGLTVVQIASYPLKADYVVNETLDYAGLRVMKRLPSGTEQDITLDCVLLPEEGKLLTAPGDVMLDVRYEGKTLGTFWVWVAAAKIEKLPDKLIYSVGDIIDYTGIEIIEILPDGEYDITDECAFDPPDGTPITDTGPITVTVRHDGEVVSKFVIETAETIAGDGWWRLFDNGLLSIYCVGDMPDYDYNNPPPWYTYESSINLATVLDSVTSIGSYAFYSCGCLTDISISDNVTYIGDEAFAYCYDLSNITLPNGITSIGSQTFAACTRLSSVIIPNSVTSIGKKAFIGCRVLNTTLPDGVTSIGEGAFYGCKSLTNVIIPNGLTSIEASTFEYCDALKSIIIPGNIDSIGEFAFYGCANLENVTIEDGVTNIGDSAFLLCASLTSFIIPDSVTHIGSHTFSGCSSLTSVTYPSSLSYIGAGTFSGCTNLTNAVISNGVEIIGPHAFYDCTNLTSITIPDSVRIVDVFAFDGCTNLTDVYYSGPSSRIVIRGNNAPLDNATWHYNSTGPAS